MCRLIITVKTQIIEPCAMSLELQSLVRSGVFFCFFMAFRGAEYLVFLVCFSPPIVK